MIPKMILEPMFCRPYQACTPMASLRSLENEIKSIQRHDLAAADFKNVRTYTSKSDLHRLFKESRGNKMKIKRQNLSKDEMFRQVKEANERSIREKHTDIPTFAEYTGLKKSTLKFSKNFINKTLYSSASLTFC